FAVYADHALVLPGHGDNTTLGAERGVVAVPRQDEGVVGVLGSVTLRLTLAAAVLWVFVRPSLRGRSRADWLVVSLFAAALTLMNLSFYASLTRLPIGVAVTIEFLGPLALAAATSKRARDLAAVAAALVG